MCVCVFSQSLCCMCWRSAGIGRTGVLITMETAMCLIEANQPVYPLNIVRQMRDQRAMLIQTSVSLTYMMFTNATSMTFVCLSVCNVGGL